MLAGLSRTVAAALALGLAAVPATAGALRIGDAAPVEDLALATADGRAVALSAGDNGMLVVFHAAACPDADEAVVVAIGNRAVAGLVRTYVIDPSGAAAPAPAGTAPARFERVADTGGSAVSAFGASYVPEAFLFDGRGRLAFHGSLAGAGAQSLGVALEAVAARKPVSVTTSSPAGCDIASLSE